MRFTIFSLDAQARKSRLLSCAGESDVVEGFVLENRRNRNGRTRKYGNIHVGSAGTYATTQREVQLVRGRARYEWAAEFSIRWSPTHSRRPRRSEPIASARRPTPLRLILKNCAALHLNLRILRVDSIIYNPICNAIERDFLPSDY